MKAARINISFYVPEQIARSIECEKNDDNRRNRLVYCIIQDFDDPSTALCCIQSCLYAECKKLEIDPVDFCIRTVEQFRRFEDEGEE